MLEGIRTPSEWPTPQLPTLSDPKATRAADQRRPRSALPSRRCGLPYVPVPLLPGGRVAESVKQQGVDRNEVVRPTRTLMTDCYATNRKLRTAAAPRNSRLIREGDRCPRHHEGRSRPTDPHETRKSPKAGTSSGPRRDACLGRKRVWATVRRALSLRLAQAGVCQPSFDALEGRPKQRCDRICRTVPCPRSAWLRFGAWSCSGALRRERVSSCSSR
jgi:hypothetical protein